MQMPSFMIPAGETSIASPQEVERKRLIALALMRQGMDTGPTDMWGGVARLGQSVVGALMNKKADRQEQAGRDDANQNFTAIMERLMGPSSATAAPAGGNFNAEVQPSPYEAQGVPDPRSPEFNVIDDRELPVDPRYIQAQPQGQQPQPAQPQGNEFAQMDQLPMGEIIGLLNNPYLQPGQAQFLQSFVQNKMDTGEWQSAGGGVIFNNRTGEKMKVAEPEAPEMPTAVREYEYAKAQGFKGTLQDWKTLNNAGNTVNVNMPGQIPDADLRKNLDDEQAKVWGEYLRAGAVSGANSQDFAILDELLQIAPQGPIQGRLAQAFPGFSSAGDAVQSIVKRIAPTLRAPGSGATSDIEYQGMLDSLPALRNNPNANRMILEIMRSKADLNVKRADIISRYQTGELDAATARRGVAELDKVSIITPQMREALIGIQRPQAVEIDGYTIEPIEE
jgi:hypothetical protein